MNKPIIVLACLAFTMMLHTACNNHLTKDKNKAANNRKTALFEKPIEKSGYFISLPADYSVKISDGPDFTVWYFLPTDTTVKNKLSGGLYFGNFPHQFGAENDSCKTETLKGEILGNMEKWTVYNCQGDYSIQTITNNKKAAGWNQKIHAFGHAKNQEELQTILDIFSTLLKK